AIGSALKRHDRLRPGLSGKAKSPPQREIAWACDDPTLGEGRHRRIGGGEDVLDQSADHRPKRLERRLERNVREGPADFSQHRLERLAVHHRAAKRAADRIGDAIGQVANAAEFGRYVAQLVAKILAKKITGHRGIAPSACPSRSGSAARSARPPPRSRPRPVRAGSWP